MKDRVLISTALLLCGLLVFGQAVSYWALPYHYEAGAEADGDTLEYTVSSSTPAEYAVLLLSDVSYAERLYIYYDEGYANPTISHSSQSSFIRQLTLELDKRGSVPYTLVGAEEMGTLAPSAGGSLLFCSGAFPDTLYDGTSESGIFDWFDAGSSVYWIGDALGRYVSSPEDVAEVTGYQTLFFGSEGCLNISGSWSGYDRSSELGALLCLKSNTILYGLETGRPDTQYVGYDDGGFSSISVTSMGHGSCLIMGYSLSKDASSSLAQAIASGVSYDTSIVGHSGGTVNGTVTGSFAAVPEGSGLYIFIGGSLTVYGKRVV
ncbi:MAG: hypothetical protein RBQ77_00835 [Candidatus Methanomethylophilaceae archaeon]|nr:hypothetical protein [Candidatus Methanomethylophilaceae archaeon]NLF33310.1 hypothetical protein [Thermoplasmatales archaeon]